MALHLAAAPRCALQPQVRDQEVQEKAQAKGQVTSVVDGRVGQETLADLVVQEVSEGQAAQEEDRTARAVQARTRISRSTWRLRWAKWCRRTRWRTTTPSSAVRRTSSSSS